MPLPPTEPEPPFKEEVVVVVEDSGPVGYLEHMSTSTAGLPATLEEIIDVSMTTPPILAFATKPIKVLEIVYLILSVFVAGALSLSIVIEIKRQQPLQIAYGTGLVTVMILLFYVHLVVSRGVVIM